eukprot:gnl/TRDRNA2_/TRDRNA2_134250_c0_seq1.p1 gnl/TRDRNA2_/TRDRNA2_134250_c0~~gnl/TRDRNA2_/TRDRNA2_134250_c0_seq1.p1  ORF type:complete len:388 (+),score=47.11 gnl/TRDRNA2_/TRDRNA2_134250_c0_seq1:50-1213(+)
MQKPSLPLAEALLQQSPRVGPGAATVLSLISLALMLLPRFLDVGHGTAAGQSGISIVWAYLPRRFAICAQSRQAVDRVSSRFDGSTGRRDGQRLVSPQLRQAAAGAPRRQRAFSCRMEAANASQPSGKCEHSAALRKWTEQVIIDLGICPWATESHNQERLKFMTYEGDSPSDVAKLIETEIERLTCQDAANLTSTLIVCPNVEAWNNFTAFDAWVNPENQPFLVPGDMGIFDYLDPHQLVSKVYLVPFHPAYARWPALPEGLGEGSVVNSHYQSFPDGTKSSDSKPATIVSTDYEICGVRKIRLKFHDSGIAVAVPIEWLDQSGNGSWPLLPANAMHHAPYPTIHLIRRADLSNVEMDFVDVMLLRNAEMVDKLGWEGFRKAAQLH